jgi:hypothetical protein
LEREISDDFRKSFGRGASALGRARSMTNKKSREIPPCVLTGGAGVQVAADYLLLFGRMANPSTRPLSGRGGGPLGNLQKPEEIFVKKLPD